MKAMTPLRAIRKHCVQCCGGSVHEVNLCPDTECNLYQYRFGHNPSRKGLGNPEALEKYRESYIVSDIKSQIGVLSPEGGEQVEGKKAGSKILYAEANLQDRLLTTDEVSQILGISKDLVRRYAREDYIPHTKIGDAVRFERAKPLRTERKREKDQKEGLKGITLNKQNNQKEIPRIALSDSQDLVISVVDDEK